MGGNFRGVLIFVDFVGPMQTTKNSLKISADPRKIAFWGLKPRIYLCSRSYIYVASYICTTYVYSYIHTYIAIYIIIAIQLLSYIATSIFRI